jgi:hypothetical protein
MSKSCLFPYGLSFQESGHISIFPAAHIAFHTQQREWVSLVLLIDSGATISTLPSSDAVLLGIEVEHGEPMTVMGLRREPLAGWRHQLRVRLGANELVVPVVFLDDPQTPRVLGRAGVFEQFTVVFAEAQRRTGLLGDQTHEARTISTILDQV